MHSEYIKPKHLYFVGILPVNATDPVFELSTIEKLHAIALADFRAIYFAVTRGYPLSADQAYAVKKIRRDKSGQLIELSMKNRISALVLLCKAMGWNLWVAWVQA